MMKVGVNSGSSQITIKITNDRNFFWQWDSGCELIVTGVSAGDELHFFREGMTEPFVLKVKRGANRLICDVPDELLQTEGSISVFAYRHEEDGGYTAIERRFSIKPRPKPVDYIYTPTERLTVDKIVDDALAEAKENGYFNTAGSAPKKGVIEILESAWVGSGTVYSQIVNLSGASENSKVDLLPSPEQLKDLLLAEISLVAANDNGVISVYAVGGLPSGDYTMQALITEVVNI